MKIRFKKRWRQNREGDVREFPDGSANVLIRRGIAVQVKRRKLKPSPVGK